MTPALVFVRGCTGVSLPSGRQCRSRQPLESELKMNFENNTDPVCITSDEGDALVPGTQARAVAQQVANATGKPVTIRNPVTDKVRATIRPAKITAVSRMAIR
jgi:hypothetical protein